MITKRQYQRLMREYQKSGKIVVSAMKADVHPQTARKYIQGKQAPEELQARHNWRTRPDPVAPIWPEAQRILADAPELEAKELFEHLLAMYPEEVDPEHLRTFQRRVRHWRLLHGPDKEVFFAQDRQPGEVIQVDWTHAKSLGVSIAGHDLDHLLCHAVLPYSNWQWAVRCQSESLLSLRHGLQAALHQLGWVPAVVQTDQSSAATHQIGTGGQRVFNPDYLTLTAHYGLKAQTINVACPNENGDVESLNGHLKRRLKQHLLLRGYRDFPTVDAYDQFLVRVLRKANEQRKKKLAVEIQGMKPLPPTRLSAYDEVRCRVSKHSTIRVKKVIYSVPARFIGHDLQVEVYEGELKIYSGRELLLQLPRARGAAKAVIDYRHLIEHLLRKPGAFAQYVHREELFPDSGFRLAYDRLVSDHGQRQGQLEYLHLLRLAAELGESAISGLVAEWAAPNQPGQRCVSQLRKLLGVDPRPVVPELTLEPQLSGYDALLSHGEQEVEHVG
jgi:transposase